MNEEKIIRKQLIENMKYNLLAFTIIFTIFGAVIYNQVKISVYSKVEDDLLKYNQTAINIKSKEVIYKGANGVSIEPPIGFVVEQPIGSQAIISRPDGLTRNNNK